MAEAKPRFSKLNNSNYANWKFRMELLLRKQNLWKKVIEGPRPRENRGEAGNIINAAAISDWDEKDDEARGTIGLLVMDDQLCHIRHLKTAKETWNALKEYHERNTLTNKVFLMRSICSLKLEEGGDAVSHINNMNDLFTKLRDIGEETLTDKWSAAMLLSSLPESYDTLITSLESRKEEEITFAFVQQRVIAEFERRLHSNGVSNDAVMKIADNSNKTCFFCKKPGHQKKNCVKYKNWKIKQDTSKNKYKVHAIEEKQESPKPPNDFLFNFGSASKGSWLIDSGATRHVVNNKEFFRSLNETYKSTLQLANGENIFVQGLGYGDLKIVNDNGVERKISMKEVLYVPTLVGNILSVRQLSKDGYEVKFKGNVCEITQRDITVGIADVSGEMYILRTPDAVCTLTQHNENCIHQWHRRLGHRDPKAIRKMEADGLVEGMKIVNCNIKESCETCIKGKMTRLPFPKQSTCSSKAPLDLIHTDVCGPMQTATANGKRYIVTFIDDFSSFTVIQLLKEKSEVEGTIREFIKFCNTLFGSNPKVIRSDRGGEYTGKRLQDYLKSEGIQVQFTTPYSPQQNGKAERKNRTLVEMSRCLLIDADLPKSFWGEAVSTANYIQNRVLTRATKQTPYELWYGKKPDVSNLHIFGSKCFVHIPSEKRQKLDSTANQMIFLGYDANSKGYRCYDASKNKVVVSRDVRFTEVELRDCSMDFPQKKQDTLQIEEENLPVSDSVSNSDENLTSRSVSSNQENEGAISNVQIQEESENDEEQTVRVSKRSTKGIPAKRLIDEIWMANHEPEPKTYDEAIKGDDKDKWFDAMQEEIKAMRTNNTWDIVPLPEGRKAVGSKWVFKLKRNANGDFVRYKARLVAQGYSQKYGVDYNEVFSPVVMHTTFRMLLSVAAKRNLIVQHIDAKTAFLNGNLEETIYMVQPKGFEDGNEKNVCLLKKAIYGLKQASRSWNNLLNETLTKAKLKQSVSDPCFYSGYILDQICYIIIYVDDIILACSTTDQIQCIEKILSDSFVMKNLGDIRSYLGIQISKDLYGNYEICQSQYIKRLADEFGLGSCKLSKSPMDINYGKKNNSNLLETNAKYRKLIGHLLYISVNSRPDISASVCFLSQKVSNPSEEDWKQSKRVVKYLVHTASMKLNLSNVQKDNLELIGYADASWADDQIGRKSTSGRIFFYNGGTISWTCQKQSIVATSTCEAEYISMSEAGKETKWLRQLLRDFNEPPTKPTVIFNDNQSCLRILTDDKFSFRTKHMDIKYKFTKELVKNNIIICEYCPTEDMIADILTKPLPISKHEFLRLKCNIK